MKYIVTLNKVIKKTVVLTAANDDEADMKLRDNEIDAEFEEVISYDTYNGFEYVTHAIRNGDDLICNIDDFAKALGVPVKGLERYFYRNTDCGMCIRWDDKSITLTGYVEGADCEHPSQTVYFPFTMDDIDYVVNELEAAADKMWHEWND